MKKFLVVLLMFMLMATPAFAQARGALTNTYASWVSVTGLTTVTLPANSRDVWIHNGSAVDVCVSLRGETIPADCMVGTPNSTFQINGTASFYAQDFITDSITFISSTGSTASPVSVVVTY